MLVFRAGCIANGRINYSSPQTVKELKEKRKV